MIDALDHVADDFARGVPNAKLLAEFGVEGLEERLVEILHRLFFTEGGEEVGLDAVEGFVSVV